MAMVTLTIDGREVTVEAGTSVLHAAESMGIEIPQLCYLKGVAGTGGRCRMCVVEIERAKTLQTACTAPVGNGMVVHTNSDKARKARRTVLELFLSNHRTDCLNCEKNGECKLQEYSYEYGADPEKYGVFHKPPERHRVCRTGLRHQGQSSPQ